MMSQIKCCGNRKSPTFICRINRDPVAWFAARYIQLSSSFSFEQRLYFGCHCRMHRSFPNLSVNSAPMLHKLDHIFMFLNISKYMFIVKVYYHRHPGRLYHTLLFNSFSFFFFFLLIVIIIHTWTNEKRTRARTCLGSLCTVKKKPFVRGVGLLRHCRWGRNTGSSCAATPGCPSASGARRRWPEAPAALPVPAAAPVVLMEARTSPLTTPRRIRRRRRPIAPDCRRTPPPMWVQQRPRHRRTITTTWPPPVTIRIFR